MSGCELCAGTDALWGDADWRVTRVDDAAFPGFYRVIARAHVREFSDLDAAQRARCFELVTRVEQVLKRELAPAKINLASLGNVVPHLHWHVIARFEWDSHFPQPIWASPVRSTDPVRLDAVRGRMAAVDAAVLAALS